MRLTVACIDTDRAGNTAYLRPNCYYEGFFFRVAILPEIHDILVARLGGDFDVVLSDEIIDVRGTVVRNGHWSEIVVSDADQLRFATAWRTPMVPTRIPTIARPAG